eukprot:CCRYP_021042-RA/>CCRYP_021042-RA protein AED:0.45 eAED:0.45 QI:0/-1/0/1/-1/0/1/0/13
MCQTKQTARHSTC